MGFAPGALLELAGAEPLREEPVDVMNLLRPRHRLVREMNHPVGIDPLVNDRRLDGERTSRRAQAPRRQSMIGKGA